MYTIVTLTDGTHFRFHARSNSGLRVSFDQTDQEQVWGVIPYPPTDYRGDHAQWIADYSGNASACKEIASQSVA